VLSTQWYTAREDIDRRRAGWFLVLLFTLTNSDESRCRQLRSSVSTMWRKV